MTKIIGRLVAVMFFLLVPALVLAQASTGSLTLSTQINDDGTITPTLTWSTTPAAQSCTAAGDSAWAGTKQPAGTQELPAFPSASARLYFMTCTWPNDTQALLAWTPPTTFEPIDHDGNPSTPPVAEPLPRCAAATDTGPCLAKYRIHHGINQNALTDVRDHNFPNATSATWTNLTPGQHFFAVMAVTGQGMTSALSNTVTKTILGPVQWSQSTGVRRPSAPVLQ